MACHDSCLAIICNLRSVSNRKSRRLYFSLGQIRLSHKFRSRALEQSPRIPLPPSLPATRGEKGEMEVGEWAGGFAARHHPVIPLLSPQRGERGQGDERGLLKSTAAKFMAQADLPPN